MDCEWIVCASDKRKNVTYFYEAWGLALFVFAASCRSRRRRLPFLIGNSPSLTHTRTLAALKQTDYVNKESQRCALFGNLVSLSPTLAVLGNNNKQIAVWWSPMFALLCACVCVFVSLAVHAVFT